MAALLVVGSVFALLVAVVVLAAWGRRQEVAAALSGSRGQPKESELMPPYGLLLMIIGAAFVGAGLVAILSFSWQPDSSFQGVTSQEVMSVALIVGAASCVVGAFF